MVVTPHPFGGILLSYEDVTDRLALERSYNTLTEVQRETIDNLYEGVAVFGADGRMKLFNPGLCRTWGLDPDFLRVAPHVSAVFTLVRQPFNVSAKDRPGLAGRRAACTTHPAPRHRSKALPDGTATNLTTVPHT